MTLDKQITAVEETDRNYNQILTQQRNYRDYNKNLDKE